MYLSFLIIYVEITLGKCLVWYLFLTFSQYTAICKNIRYAGFFGQLYKTKNVLENKLHESSGEDSVSREEVFNYLSLASGRAL